MNKKLRKRVFRFLNSALCRRAFRVDGSLIGLSADAIADEIATVWDAETSVQVWPRSSDITAADLTGHVQDWLALNEEALDEEARGGRRTLAG